ncbi:uncharacterized protein OCT59_022601 [Rhizophagus irregularis]|uniref:uncharacterized protein n=1 Tax=Rhizophagus irregularis TaxID=588596 RepID=UPI00332CED31|nr:hypothetical protein OCT59_022601 [Rhizophagus irregularis]
MTRPSKRKSKAKEQERNNYGTFTKKSRISDELDEWGDENDSGWDDDEVSLLNEKKALELTWSDNTHLEQKKRGPYLTGKIKKSTYFDKYGPSGSFTKAAKRTMKISTFMNRNQTIPDDFVEVLDDLDEEEQNQLNIDERIKNLKTELGEQQKILTVTEYNKKRAIYEYLKRLDENGKGKMKASKEAAQLIFIDCAPNRARSIQYWANFWLQNNHLPMSRQGKHQKTIRLIDDEDIAVKCHTWIRSQGGTTTPLKFKEFVEQKLLINSGITKKKTIAKATATRWLNVLGYSFQSQKQGTYYDGHERPDVVEYRKLFLDKIYSYERYMAKYEGETMERIPPMLESNNKEIILVTHDECIFYSNDGKRGVWTKTGELPLRKKGNGRSIMVSEFLSEECGRLKLNAQQHQENSSIPQEARTYLQPGKDREGYWTSEHLIDQVKTKAIPIFKTLFPNCIGLFAFDNSSNHAAFRHDALVASKMNLKPGGKQPKMRNTVFGLNNQYQSMVNENGEPKGMKQVLIERGLWKNGLNADCQLCKDKVDDITRIDCCARRIISLQPDFLAQKSALEEAILEAGHLCIFYPKFHCELNFIERYFGGQRKDMLAKTVTIRGQACNVLFL